VNRNTDKFLLTGAVSLSGLHVGLCLHLGLLQAATNQLIYILHYIVINYISDKEISQ
jgi:hypothetical protein